MPSSLANKDDFPAAAEVVYLNQASVGLVPVPVRAVLRAAEDALSRDGTISFDDQIEAQALDGVRAAAGRLLNAVPASIAVLSSATEAVNQFAWWLRPAADANVVLIDADFPSVVLPWLRVAEETGVELRMLAVREEPKRLTTAALVDLVDANTAAVCVSHVQFATGHRLDLSELGRAAAAADAYLVVDATQSAGIVPLDVAATPVDMLVASSHKWLCAPYGAALCHLGPRLDAVFRPPFVGWRGAADPATFDTRSLALAATARRMELGTIAYAAATALGAAIDYLSELTLPRVSEHGLRLAGQLHTGLTALGASVVTPSDPRLRAAIVTARFAEKDGADVARTLQERGVYVSPRLGGVRFSAHVFNDENDVDRALDAVAAATGRHARGAVSVQVTTK